MAHKVEAIRQINLELSKDDVPDAVILAILSLARGLEETKSEKQERIEVDRNSPFKPPLMPLQWQENFTRLTQEEVHVEGARAIVNLKGGINRIKSSCIAKSFSQ